MNCKQPLETYRACWAIAMILVIVCTIVPARIYNWPSPSSPDWLWVLITLEFIVGIGILAKLETRQLSDKDEIKKRRVNTVALFLIVTGLLLIAYFLEKIEVGDIITILVLFGTVLVAAEYANDTKRIAEATKEQASEIQKQAKATADMAEATKEQAVTTATTATATERQAEASIKMAEEMRNQRYEMARPVIDFWFASTDEILKSQLPEDVIEEYLSEGWRPSTIIFKVQNIGFGPAIDVRTTIDKTEPSKIRRIRTISTFEKDIYMLLDHRDNFSQLRALIAVYKDIHGRFFKSSRKILLKQEKTLQLEELEIQQISEEEFVKFSGNI